MTKNDILTRDEIDAMWQQALCKAVADGEMYTRYQFAELLEAKVRADEREAVIKATIDQGFVGQAYADDFAAAIRARGEK